MCGRIRDREEGELYSGFFSRKSNEKRTSLWLVLLYYKRIFPHTLHISTLVSSYQNDNFSSNSLFKTIKGDDNPNCIKESKNAVRESIESLMTFII